MTKVGGEIQGRTGVLNEAPYATWLRGESRKTLMFRTHTYAVFGRSGKKCDHSDEQAHTAWPMSIH